jgi:lipopolysaccharide/colanic/teichoic acid biosynthesis glycosyltransferase
VILSGEIEPGIYGQVQIGNTPRPTVVYERPRVIVVDERYADEEPIYLHIMVIVTTVKAMANMTINHTINYCRTK